MSGNATTFNITAFKQAMATMLNVSADSLDIEIQLVNKKRAIQAAGGFNLVIKFTVDDVKSPLANQTSLQNTIATAVADNTSVISKNLASQGTIVSDIQVSAQTEVTVIPPPPSTTTSGSGSSSESDSGGGSTNVVGIAVGVSIAGAVVIVVAIVIVVKRKSIRKKRVSPA